MNINPTVPQLREKIAQLDPKRPTSKLRKPELVALLEELMALADAEAQATTSDWEAEKADLIGEPQLYQGAMHEAAADAEQAELDDFNAWRGAPFAGDYPPVDEALDMHLAAQGYEDLEKAIKAVEREQNQRRARAMIEAWGNTVATVVSMGKRVRGKVVDTVIREADNQGRNRVCLVVQHFEEEIIGRFGVSMWVPVIPSYRRTLHAISDVALAH